jgi:hypothetical protein
MVLLLRLAGLACLALAASAAAASEAGSPAAAAAPAPPLAGTAPKGNCGRCPAASDAKARRAYVLGCARDLLNTSLFAGASYGQSVFVRDTATFVDVALDSPGRVAMVRGLIVKLMSFQHSYGDLGVEGIAVSNQL